MSSAAAAPPPPLPISSTNSPPSSTSAATSSPAIRLFVSRLSDSLRRSLANRRPWSELVDRSAFSRPDSLSDALARLRKNLSYFRVNYSAILLFALAVSLLSHPFSLLLLLTLVAAWFYLYLFRPADSPLVIMGRQFSDRETLAGLLLVTVLVVFLTSVGSVIISAITVGSAVVCAHGAFRMPEDLFLDDQDLAGPGAGLLSFLGGSAPSAVAVATGPARV